MTDFSKIIQDQINNMINIIRNKLQDYDLISIMLSGSAARGELALIKEGSKYIPFGDYDFYIVTKEKTPYEVTYEVKKEINSIVFGGTDPQRGFLVDIECRNLKQKKRFHCDLSSYDFLVTYKVLYGDDIYKDVKLSIKEVPLISPFRLIMNRLSHLAMAYSIEFTEREPTTFEYADLRKTMLKMYLEIGGLLTFILGAYSPRYKERLSVLKQKWDTVIAWGTPDELYNKIEKATHEKIEPCAFLFDDIMEERKKAAEYGFWAARLLANKLDNTITITSSLEEFGAFVLCKLPKLFYADYIGYEIKNRFGISIALQTKYALSYIANYIELYNYQKKTGYRLIKKGKHQSPILIYYFCTLYLLVSTCIEGKTEIDNSMKKKIEKQLVLSNEPQHYWETVRNICKKIWYTYKYGKLRN